MKSMLDEIYRCLADQDQGLTDGQIMKRFFKVQEPPGGMSGKIVDSLLESDGRFRKEQGRWTAVENADIEDVPVYDAPFILFAVGDVREVRQKHADPVSLLNSAGTFYLYQGGSLEPVKDLGKVLADSSGYVFVPHDVRSLSLLKRAFRILSPLPPGLLTVSIRNLIIRLFPERKFKRWEQIVQDFSLTSYESEDLSSKVRTLSEVLELLLNRAAGQGSACVADLLQLSHPVVEDVDFSRYQFDREFLGRIPLRPGVYSFLDSDGVVLYAGKAGNLRTRIRSYFTDTYSAEGEERKVRALREELYRTEYRVLGSELEAIIEEQKMIDRFSPRYNTRRSIPVRKVEIADTLVVLPSSNPRNLKLYFLSNRAPLVELEFGPDSDPRLLLRVLADLERRTDHVYDPLKVLCVMYVRRYTDQLNMIDIERFASPGKVVETVQAYAQNPEKLKTKKTGYL
jgi:hypothetical protein